MTAELETTRSTILDGTVSILQPAKGYRAAIDPVFLAAAVDAAAGDTVLDAGCGVGTAAFCLMKRVPGCRVTGIDIASGLVALALENAQQNGVVDRARFVQGDIREPGGAMTGVVFDHVMINPPYLVHGRHTPSPDPVKATANGEEAGTLDDWLNFTSKHLRKGGALTMIHRADRIDDVIAAFRAHRFGCVRVFPLWPSDGKPARRVLFLARHGKQGPAALLPGMTLHEADGGYTAAASDVLYNGMPIRFTD